MALHITQHEILRNTQIARDGMVCDLVLRKVRDMKRQRLIDARKARKLTQEAIAERMGVSVAQVSRWENGHDGIPSQRLDALVSAYEAPLDALLGGGGAEGDTVTITGSQVRWVPLVGKAPAGNWREAIEVPLGEVAVRADKAGKNAFAVEIDGDSMDLILPEGGWAVVDPDQRHFFDGRVYLVRNGDDATLKRYRSNPARLEPVSSNDSHEPIYLTGEPIKIIGRVVAYGNDQGL
jgi:SOS-response transcriptional repressor LexA